MSRRWQAIICYEDRAYFHTSRWRLDGIATRESAENTDSGTLWLEVSTSGDTLTVNLYKDDGLASENKVATGSADISGIDGTGESAAEVTLAASESSGMSGSVWIHRYDYETDPTAGIPVQVALCTDEDMGGLWQNISDLPTYDSTNGCAEFIRIAGEDILGKVAAMFRSELGGYGAAEAWFITDATRSYPDLRRLANPAQLRLACAHHALEIMMGSSHEMASSTMYSVQRDYHKEEYERAMSALFLAFKAGGGDDAVAKATTTVIHQERA